MAPRPHWLFGDQLGPHFVDPRNGGPDAQAPVVMIEARSVLRRRRFHRAKAHLVLSAMRHRAAELGDRVTYVRAETYAEGLEQAVGHPAFRRSDAHDERAVPSRERGAGDRLTVCHPTSRRALDFVGALEGVEILPAKGFMVSHDVFAEWAGRGSGKGLRLESFYRRVRERHDLLMDGDGPAGGRWNLDHEVDIDLDLRAVRDRHGTDLLTSLRADLRRLAPDLLRWHMPRIAPDGRLRPGLTISLACYGSYGATPLRLVARTPPTRADAGQRISLALICCDAAARVAVPLCRAEKIELVGGGGTDLRSGFARALRSRPRPDVIIALTDGQTPWPAAPPPCRAVVGLFPRPSRVAEENPDHVPDTPPPWARVVSIP
ncbi:cryptochrome/photolyase family protein [Streptomyces sp. NPDC051569]|uniref:cryptochrome/photolyase family protein n=1 Tax=Streptomyces sp. NPDC051569 TaxID=3365661 RepID=UPI0037936DF5